MAVAIRSATSSRSRASSGVKRRGDRLPTCTTPIPRPSSTSGVPSKVWSPLARRIGLTTSAWLMSSMTIVELRAAMLPAIPRPNGIRMSSFTSSSSPWAAFTASSVRSSLSRRITTVSAAMASRTRPRSSGRRSSRSRWVSAVSVTRCTARI